MGTEVSIDVEPAIQNCFEQLDTGLHRCRALFEDAVDVASDQVSSVLQKTCRKAYILKPTRYPFRTNSVIISYWFSSIAVPSIPTKSHILRH